MIRALAVLMLISATGASAELRGGVVFEDRDGDGVRSRSEPGVPGVVVARGSVLVRSDAEGRYEFPANESVEDETAVRATQFVVLTRPGGYDAERWYRAEAGDFALQRRAPDGDRFVFAQISDAHISDRAADYAHFAVPSAIAKMPRWLSGVSIGLMFSFQDPHYDKRRATDALREELGPYRDVEDWCGASVRGEWIRRIAAIREGDENPPIDPAGDFQASLDELRAVAPRFVVSTGDLVLESNDGDAESVDRWMRFYRERTRATDLSFYDTIGNNEIAGSDNPEFEPGQPGYGKALFRSHFGPTHYSFDRGGLHFIALDTHALLDVEDEDWRFKQLDPAVEAWLESDLAMHAGRPIVVLNHEPLGGDPEWSWLIRKLSLVDDEVTDGLERAGVRWTLAGHLHVNGLLESGGTQHITTGAFSGMRWSFPSDVLARGYRLFQFSDGELYSIWKRTGEAVFDFVDPPGNPLSFATAPIEERAETSGRRVVVAAADRAGAFAVLRARLGGEPIAVDAWSAYFGAIHYDPAALAPGEHELVFEAVRADGSGLRINTLVEGTGR